MQMARLWNPALPSSARDGYSLRRLTERRLGGKRTRRSVPERFGSASAKQPAAELQLLRREEWIRHATDGAVATFQLYHSLQEELQRTAWTLEGPQETPDEMAGLSMWDFYERYWLPLGRLLTDIELAGVPVDLARLDELTGQASERMRGFGDDFRRWARDRTAEERGRELADGAQLQALNLNSSNQLVQLFFGDAEAPPTVHPGVAPAEAGAEDEEAAPGEEAARPARPTRSREELEGLTVVELQALLVEQKLSKSGRKSELVDRLLNPDVQPKRRLRRATPKVRIYGLGLKPVAGFLTTKGQRPQASMDAFRALLAQQPKELKPDGCKAVQALVSFQEVEALLTSFLQPLRSHSSTGRVHARLNLNTETGRLSCRQPNLHSEPLSSCLPVRDVFAAPPGKRLIVADYAQLELRIVAHLADCRPMIDLLSSGGDIHSRTAYRMFDEVRAAVDEGTVRLDEERGAPGAGGPGPPLPSVKEAFSEQRRRAKVLNFSLLYGKTAYGLSREWGISDAEAQRMIEQWFDSFPEVREWKQRAEESVAELGARTLLGRSRPVRALQGYNRAGRGSRANALRAASNSPVQGSAADVVFAAMLRLDASPLLRECGYRQVLQIHDEIILEGPEEHADEALHEVVRIMEDPLPFPLRVPLPVDARAARTWHEAKQ